MYNEGRQMTAVALQTWLTSEPSDDEIPPGRRLIHMSHGTVCSWLHTLTEGMEKRIREYSRTVRLRRPSW